MSNQRKLFVVSDIHGHFTLLKEALDKAGFDKDNESHTLICCGDYFDRGTENLEVLKFLDKLKRKVLIRGNHEDLLIKLLETGQLQERNYINGSLPTIESFFGKYSINPVDDTIDFSGKTRMVDRLYEFIDETVNCYETENYLFVHGWFPDNATSEKARKDATDYEWERARWAKWIDKYDGVKPLGDKTVVCGHVPTFYARYFDMNRGSQNYDIFYGNGLIAIDAGTNDTKQVNVLVLEENF